MAIADADIRIRASERMNDFDDGGGRMSTTVIVDGLDNNLFPDITDFDRVAGRTQIRKVFPGALNATTEALMAAHVLVDQEPSDAATSCCIFASGTHTTERAAAVADLLAWHTLPARANSNTVSGALGSRVLQWVLNDSGDTDYPAVGEIIGLYGQSVVPTPATVERYVVASVGPVVTTSPPYRVVNITTDLLTLYAAPPTGTETAFRLRNLQRYTELRPYGVGVTAASTPAAASITVASVFAQLVPYSGTPPYPTRTDLGIDPGPLAYCNGRLQVIRKGDALLVHHQDGITGTVANGQAFNVGRTGLARLRIIGANGQEHARFTRGQPAPTGVGLTVDLAAGTGTITDVSGWVQPVTIEHRIEELVAATAVNSGTGAISLNRALSRVYPAGTRVSSLLYMGDLQGRATTGFMQTAWTNVWSDTRIGGEPPGDFNQAAYPIRCTNRGTVTERWACIFTSPTAYRLVGEGLGEVGTGNTGSDFAPVNPSTGAAYVTIPAAGWSSGLANGNVYRFNTYGAHGHVWPVRCVNPSLPGGDDYVTLLLRGYYNT